VVTTSAVSGRILVLSRLEYITRIYLYDFVLLVCDYRIDDSFKDFWGLRLLSPPSI